MLEIKKYKNSKIAFILRRRQMKKDEINLTLSGAAGYIFPTL